MNRYHKKVNSDSKIKFLIWSSLIFLFLLINTENSYSQKTDNITCFPKKLNKEIKKYILEGYPQCIRHCPVDNKWFTSLPFHFTSPCIIGFCNLFYWDTYFTNLGLLRLPPFDSLAKNNVDNLLFEVNRHGYVPNFNRKSGLNRSQQPYLSMMIRDIYEFNPDSTEWLKKAYYLLKTEYQFWMTERITTTGLNSCSNSANKEELKKFYKFLSKDRFQDLKIDSAKQDSFTFQAISECESWDFTPRYDRRCADFCGIDLNSNLYIYETNFIYFSKILGLGEEAEWEEKAKKRKALINQYLWSDSLNCFVDYDWVNGQQSTEITAAIFNPLWAKVATKEQAKDVVKAMKVIEFANGISVCEKKERAFKYQWDYPNGWPPLQYLAVVGLQNYGFSEDARRIANKYLNNVKRNFRKSRHLWEKYNVEAGNINVKNEYKMPSMLGWTAGVYIYLSEFMGVD